MEEKVRKEDLIKIDENIYEIPQSYRSDMRVAARIFADEKILQEVFDDRSLEQLVNVTTLPGIVQHAYAMPDMHEGYGFPIGGVAGTAIAHNGVISPGGIGYDINCGVRLLASTMSTADIEPYLESLATELFYAVPSGVGQGGKLKLKIPELNKVLRQGAQYMLELEYGIGTDIEYCEEKGMMSGANPDLISKRAKDRGRDQLGTLGSGNHFLEVQRVAEIFDQTAAQAFGLKDNMVTIMVHCGSRGLGHQTCTDYVRMMMPKLDSWGIVLPDRELVCAPFNSVEGQEYFAAMQAASNFAWANRHVIGHCVRQAWHKVIGREEKLSLVYDVSHNIGKREKHTINGSLTELLMHRKGATRSFGPGRPELPAKYHTIGQPVLIPGTMGTASYVLVGTNESMEKSLGSCCHGAGRRMSRMQAKKTIHGTTLRRELEAQGIVVRCDSDAGLAEEAPTAYKDVQNVVEVVHTTHIAHKVARLEPIAVIKGG